MILTANAIRQKLMSDIIINPFNESQLNPNSYNLRLSNEVISYLDPILDCAKKNEYQIKRIPQEGMILYPGELYLSRTAEYTETYNLVPLLEGRSSLARLGISVHLSAGFGDIGFKGYWTLEISVIRPVRIYKFMEICQIYYCEVKGYIEQTYGGKYQNNQETQPSLLYQEFQK